MGSIDFDIFSGILADILHEGSRSVWSHADFVLMHEIIQVMDTFCKKFLESKSFNHEVLLVF